MAEDREEFEEIPWAEFLVGVPPGVTRAVRGAVEPLAPAVASAAGGRLRRPRLPMHCPNAACDRILFWDCVEGGEELLAEDREESLFLAYRCCNCNERVKRFALLVRVGPEAGALVTKVGETPPFGRPLPRAVAELLAAGRVDLHKGVRAEHIGLGRAAFVYYRRAVATARDGLLDALARAVGGAGSGGAALEAARAAPHLRDCLELVAGASPSELRLPDGTAALDVLRDVLDVATERAGDEELFDRAVACREVLTFLAERVDSLTRPRAELQSALRRYAQRRPGVGARG